MLSPVPYHPPKNDDQITFRLPAADKKDLKAAAERRQRPHNWLARDIVLKWLVQERKRRAKSNVARGLRTPPT